MKLIEINKTRYRRHLKIVMAGCAVGLALGSLGVSQTLIAFFPDESGSHFYWNLLGVVVAGVTMAWFLNRSRQHDFMTEVVYVWELKQSLNKINRKIAKLDAASREGDADALLAMHYSYAASRLLWQLDDNTLLMDELLIKQADLNNLAAQYEVTLNADDYSEALLARF
ncbi:hypothetical protein IMCC1989_2757 [gamma proteobacterium IMCC1989]|nr:hypothetical protein IMCC1989_2757 [gamma proteobacterium IMCC1989]